MTGVQPTPPGWYWDPGNRPGLFRWWDGREWTESLSARWDEPPPHVSAYPAPDDDGYFRTAGLAVPALPDPWRACPVYPDIDEGRAQEVVVGKTARGPYVGAVCIGRLPDRFAGDGLAAAGAAFADEVLDTFYPHEKPHAGLDPHEEQVLGRPAWTLVVPLDIDDPSLEFAEEDALFVVVETDGGAGVLFASLPRVNGVPSVEEVRGGLRLA